MDVDSLERRRDLAIHCRLGVQLLTPFYTFHFPDWAFFYGGLMEKPAQNIQDSFLNNARKDKTVLTIYLMSGVKLSGRIKSFDKYSLVLETNNQEQLIFKHAISTVVTQKSSHSYSGTAQNSAVGAGSAVPGSPVHADAPEA
jgi:host factor-I protein